MATTSAKTDSMNNDEGSTSVAVCRGRCPACHATLSINDDQMSSVIDCDCGETLYVCDSHSFVKIPISCHTCNRSYQVTPDNIGKTLKCKCGASIDVLETVLRQPVRLNEAAAESIAGPLYHSPTKDLNDSAQDDSLGDASSPLIIDTSELPPKPAPTQRVARNVTTRSNESTEDSKRKTSVTPVLGWILAGVFFLVSLGLFFWRSPVSPIRADPAQTTSTSAIQNKARQQASHAYKTLSPKQWANFAAKTRLHLDHAEDDSAASANANSRSASSVEKTNSGTDPYSAFGGRTTPRPFVLPEATRPRERVELVTIKRQPAIFNSAYQELFASYEKLTELDSKPGTDLTEEYKQQLGATLSLAKHAYSLSSFAKTPKKQIEVTYLLAYLSFTAGHLMEAAIYGEAVAKFGDTEDSSTHEALLIALAATQEANANQWGDPESVGELRQMESLAELVDTKWPDDPQRGAIWLALGNAYNEFGEPGDAARAFGKVPKSSKHFESAKIAVGMASWNRFLDQASVDAPNPGEMVSLLKSARKKLIEGVNAKQNKKPNAKQPPDLDLIVAKVTLARIAHRLGDSADVVKWLTKAPIAVTNSITTNRTEKTKRLVDTGFASSIFDLLYRARADQDDFVGANQAIVRFAKIAGTDQADTVGRMRTQIAIAEMKRLLGRPSIQKKDVEGLKQMLNAIDQTGGEMPVANQMWLAQSWASLANKTGALNLKQDCFSQAADAQANAIKSNELPAKSIPGLQIRLAEMLRNANRRTESVEMASNVLSKTPNVIELQIQVAQSIQQKAENSRDSTLLQQAINGRSDDAVWGWAKLAVNLHALKYSSKGTAAHAEQLMQAQYELARSRWLIATLSKDPQLSVTFRKKAQRQVAQLLAVLPDDSTSESDTGGSMKAWRTRFESLRDLANST